MARLWKSQELFGAPFGPCRAEETALQGLTLEAAEHKSPSSSSTEPATLHSSTQSSSKHAPMSFVSFNPFTGSIPELTEDILAAYQEACLRGQPTPNFSFPRPSPSLSSESIPNPNPKSFTSQGSDQSNPVFSLSAVSPLPSRPPHSPKLSPSLSASTGNLTSIPNQSHRRTRSYFYANGEAPIVAVGEELEDDDQSSDEESTLEPPSSHTSTRHIEISQNLPLDGLSGSVPTLKTSAMKMPTRKRVEEDREVLPDSPPSRAVNPLRASTATYAGTSSIVSSSPREIITSDLATPLSAPKTHGPPFVASQPPFDMAQSGHQTSARGYKIGLAQSSAADLPSSSSVNHHPAPLSLSSELDLSTSPIPHSVAPDLTDDITREQEWRDLECTQHERCSDPSRSSLSSISANQPHKNRYPSVLAFDSTRVKLSPSPEDGSDYINANFVQGAGDALYISAQAPIPASFNDFWRMIWEYKVHIIVMLTRLIESGCPKAHKYWPTSKTRVYGDRYRVTLVNRQESDYEYRVKEFEVECDGERRRVFQFQFMGWPDHGVPHSPENILHMVKSINHQMQELKDAPFCEGPSPRIYGMTTTVSDASSVASTDTEDHDEPVRMKRSSSSEFRHMMATISLNSHLSGATTTTHSRQESPLSSSTLAYSSTLPNKDSIISPEGSSKSASQLPIKTLLVQRPHLLRDSASPTGSQISLSPSPSGPSSSEASLESSTSSAVSLGSSVTSAVSSTSSYLSMSLLSSTHSSLGSVRNTSPSHMANSGSTTTTVPSPSSSASASTSSTPTSLDRPNPCASKAPYAIGPMVVHCSAGIGRSGAFIIIHSVLEKLAAEGKTFNDINLKQLLDHMRTSREGLVTHQLQYNFCYDSIEYSLRYQRIVQEIGTTGLKGKQRQNLQKSPLTRSSHVIPNMAGHDSELHS